MNSPDIHRLSAGTVTFQMRLHHPVWSYDHEALNRLVDVEVEVRALMRLSSAGARKYAAKPTLAGNRHTIEEMARRIIDREGPNFVQPVRVTARDMSELEPIS